MTAISQFPTTFFQVAQSGVSRFMGTAPLPLFGLLRSGFLNAPSGHQVRAQCLLPSKAMQAQGYREGVALYQEHGQSGFSICRVLLENNMDLVFIALTPAQHAELEWRFGRRSNRTISAGLIDSILYRGMHATLIEVAQDTAHATTKDLLARLGNFETCAGERFEDADLHKHYTERELTRDKRTFHVSDTTIRVDISMAYHHAPDTSDPDDQWNVAMVRRVHIHNGNGFGQAEIAGDFTNADITLDAVREAFNSASKHAGLTADERSSISVALGL